LLIKKGGTVVRNNLFGVMLMLLVLNAQANAYTGNVNFFLGQKSLDSDDWRPLEDQGEFGVLVDFKQSHWPVSVAIDILVSADEATELGIRFEGITSEINGGVRKIWEVSGSSIRPYIGGGLALVSADLEASAFTTVSDDDNSIGIWLNGGIYWTLGKSFNLGLDIRYSQAEVTIVGVDVEAGGTHAGLILGYHW
jgi:hypothetical protein